MHFPLEHLLSTFSTYVVNINQQTEQREMKLFFFSCDPSIFAHYFSQFWSVL